MTTPNQVFSLAVHAGIAHLTMDDKTAELNTLKTTFIEEFSKVLDQIKNDAVIQALFILSGKTHSFIVGADIHMLAACKTQAQALSLSQQGQALFAQLAALPIPTVAIIDGTCMGGGLELALACDYRLCSDHKNTRFSLPEVKLGLLPGAGGTQRLPALIGVKMSLDLMLTGKEVSAKQALKCGLVDDVVQASSLLHYAEKVMKKTPHHKHRYRDLLLEGNSLGRKFIYHKAKKSVLAKTQGNYPAPLKIIECVHAAMEKTPQQGLQLEAACFAELVVSSQSKQLIHLFFLHKKFTQKKHDTVFSSIGVLGGGLMGGGIAYVCASRANAFVRMKDINTSSIRKALQYSYQLYQEKVKRSYLTVQQCKQKMHHITGTLDYSGFSQCDVVIEAVFEELTLKQAMLKDVESNTSDATIFASNTSSLSISDIAMNAKRPENVIGMHFFSPVEKMPLVEVIPHAKTAKTTLEKIKHLAIEQGKVPIVVADSAGFFINRILASYINEALYCLKQGQGVDTIDKAFVAFGFPLGPIQLLDEIGLDVSIKISPILESAFGQRLAPPTFVKKLVNDGRKGKKNHRGFYLYSKGSSKKKVVDESIYCLLNITLNNAMSNDDVVKRCVYLMLNEAVRCIEDKVITECEVGDIGAIFGMGFPPFLGGPYRYIDIIGAQHIVDNLLSWKSCIGMRFQPCELLLSMARNHQTFYPEN